MSKEMALDIIGVIGTILTVIGIGLIQNEWQSWLGAVGFGLLLAQMQLIAKQRQAQLLKVEEEQKSLIEDLLIETGTTHHALALVGTVLSITRNSKSSKPNIVAASEISTQYIKEYLPSLLEVLRKGTGELLDRSLVQDLLINLSSAISHKGAWFGISRLISEEAWHRESSQSGFAMYLEKMYQLVREGKKRYPNRSPVRRLYAVDEVNVSDGLRKIFNSEREKGVEIKYDKLEDPMDISLIYQNYPKSDVEMLNPTLALVFDVSSTFDQLTRIRILNTVEAQKLAVLFVNAWNSARN